MEPPILYAEAITNSYNESIDATALNPTDLIQLTTLPDPDESGAREFLSRENWPTGLQELFIKGCNTSPIRFIIVDDSGSMTANDGRMLIVNNSKMKSVVCSRWAELVHSLKFLLDLAENARAPTEFRLLNNSNPIMVGCQDDNGEGRLRVLSMLEQSPSGSTPLCRHISEVVEQIKDLAPQLRANSQKAVLVIATDGEASDGDIINAMKPLQNLPVWVVVRLCTDDDRVCEYWNRIDKLLEIDLEVLDDFASESLEIRASNDWFTYGEPLHRLREFGITMKDMDLLDECVLSSDQMRRVLTILTIGGPVSNTPNPDVDWNAFLRFAKNAVDQQPNVWCPVDRASRRWIRLERLNKTYGKGRAQCMIM